MRGIITSLEGVQLFGFGALTSFIDIGKTVINIEEKLRECSKAAPRGNIKGGCAGMVN